MQLTDDTRRFYAADPVAVYWLAHCEGFTVASPSGKPVATVDDRAFDPIDGETVAVTVVHGRRRSVVPADAVTAVVPATATLLVDAATYRRLRPASSVALEHAARRAEDAARAAARRAILLARTAAERLASRLERGRP